MWRVPMMVGRWAFMCSPGREDFGCLHGVELLCQKRGTLRPHGEERCPIAGAACVNLAAMQRVSNTHVGFTRRALKEGPISGKPEIGPGRERRTALRDADTSR